MNRRLFFIVEVFLAPSSCEKFYFHKFFNCSLSEFAAWIQFTNLMYHKCHKQQEAIHLRAKKLFVGHREEEFCWMCWEPEPSSWHRIMNFNLIGTFCFKTSQNQGMAMERQSVSASIFIIAHYVGNHLAIKRCECPPFEAKWHQSKTCSDVLLNHFTVFSPFGMQIKWRPSCFECVIIEREQQKKIRGDQNLHLWLQHPSDSLWAIYFGALASSHLSELFLLLFHPMQVLL